MLAAQRSTAGGRLAAVPTSCRRQARRAVQPVRALMSPDLAAAAGVAALAASPIALAAGGLAAAGLASLAPQPPAPPPTLRQPVSVDLEGGQTPLNTHGVGRAGEPPRALARPCAPSRRRAGRLPHAATAHDRARCGARWCPCWGSRPACPRMRCRPLPRRAHPSPHSARPPQASSRRSRGASSPSSAWAGGTRSATCPGS